MGIDYPNMIVFPINRMDLLFWNNIEHFKNDLDLITNNINLGNFNLIYDDYSLFHYFAENEGIINYINNLYISSKEEKSLGRNEYFTPLCLLKPDREGNSALDLALKKQRLKSFELMIEILEDFPTM